MMDLSVVDLVIVGLCAMMVGITKTGLPGLGILAVPLMASVLPARSSVGLLLGILILADLFAAGYYRRSAQWGHIVRLLPATFVGILAGYFSLKVVDDSQLRPIIGVIVLVMLAVNYWRNRAQRGEIHIPNSLWFAVSFGFVAGFATMMANAAGPVMIIYLLAMRLPKVEFVGTRAWFFFIVNWLKVPFSASLGLMTLETVKIDLIMLPFIVVGAAVGILILRRIPQRAFSIVVQILAVVAAVKLLF